MPANTIKKLGEKMRKIFIITSILLLTTGAVYASETNTHHNGSHNHGNHNMHYNHNNHIHHNNHGNCCYDMNHYNHYNHNNH